MAKENGIKDAMVDRLLLNSARIKVEDDVTPVGDIVVDLNKVEGLNLHYDLSGRVVEKPSNGIYIHKGKKVLVK